MKKEELTPAMKAERKRARERKIKHFFARFSPLTVVLLLVLVFYTLTLFGLLYWGFISTFKEYIGDFRLNNGFTLPKKWDVTYYKYFLTKFNISVILYDEQVEIGIVEMFHNSLVYALGCAFLQTLIPCLTAYVCARYKFKFLNIYYFIVIVTMVIPIVGSTASEIQMATTFGLYNQLWGLWIMKANFLGLYFLIFHSTFKNMPDSFSEAAKIDGASNWTIMTKIMLPLVKNTFLTIFLIYFIQFWNDYQTPLLYLTSRPTIFYAIYHNMFLGRAQEVANICGEMAIAFIGLVPTTVVFICFHKKLLGSITVGGIK